MKRILATSLFFISCLLISKAQTVNITALNGVHQCFGNGVNTREVIDTVIFPSELINYDSINMHVALAKPSIAGVDPWDRFAKVSVYKNGEWFEIGRYMTPYGKACGWDIDVTDYRGLLQDTVIIKSFIDTWVNPGWKVTITFNLLEGTPEYYYTSVENLWVNDNVVYGDSTQPIQLDTISKYDNHNAENIKLRIVNTGHGQGNTNNAAEFSQKTHHIWVNGTDAFSHLLWRSDCAQNPCSNQAGSWTYNRANWCPGADVAPLDYDVTSMFSDSIKIQYKLQDYYNSCSPNNPSCATSSSCPDCNYNYNGHTEPHYKISGQLIYRSNPPASVGKDLIAKNFRYTITPNPSTGKFQLNFNSGKTYLNNLSVNVYNTIGELIYTSSNIHAQSTNTMDLRAYSNGVYIIQLNTPFGVYTQKAFVSK